MKNLRKNAAMFVLAAGCLVGIGANAKTFSITAGYYQASQGGTITPLNTGDGPLSGTPASYCQNPTTPNCVAEFDTNGNMVASTLIKGTFTD